MAQLPETSETLLLALAQDSQHARWGEFVATYRPLMERYVVTHFPTVERDEVIQETLIALIKILPGYHYHPQETGFFHNYLTGVVKRKCLKFLERTSRYEIKRHQYAQQTETESVSTETETAPVWQHTIFEIALQQLLTDETIQERTRLIFTKVAVNGESPEAVATAFGITRNTVDQIKNRTMKRLREYVEALEKVANV